MNEELQTLNAELQAKVDELSQTSNDMKNLLDSTDIATLFLGQGTVRAGGSPPRRRRSSSSSRATWAGLSPTWPRTCDYPELADDAREVLRTLVATEKPMATRDGRWFTVRIMPYRTLDDRIDGVVITFTDITAAKTLEAKLRGEHASLEKRVAGQSAKLEKEKKSPQADALGRKRGKKRGGKPPRSRKA